MARNNRNPTFKEAVISLNSILHTTMKDIKMRFLVSILKCFLKDTFMMKETIKLNINIRPSRYILSIKNSIKLYIKKHISTKKYIKYDSFFLISFFH